MAMPPMFGLQQPKGQHPDRRRVNQAHILEAAAAAVLAAAVLGTASGMGWLVIALPSKLQQLQEQISQIVKNQEAFSEQFNRLQERVLDHDRRIIRLEVER